jgi:hypothetical protein
MSSAVYVTLPQRLPIERWDAFCQANNIGWASHTIGQNVYYLDPQEVRFGPHTGIVGHVEIRLDQQGTLQHRDGSPLWNTATPPSHFRQLTVSTFFTGDVAKLTPVANLAVSVVRSFGARWEADPELDRLMRERLEIVVA